MGHSHTPLLMTSLAILVFIWPASAQICPKSFPFNSQNRSFASCQRLPELNATLSWTYHPQNGSMDLAFRAPPATSAGWVAWGINPTATGMVGTQALLAFRQSNGTMVQRTYNITSKEPPLKPSNISLPVSNLTSQYENGQITIFATLGLPSNKTTVNHVWEVGSHVVDLVPQMHAFNSANLNSRGPISLI